MLSIAYPYSEELNKAWQKVVFSDKYKYYNSSTYWEYEIEVEKSSWNKIQCVSVDKNQNILGYISAKCDRSANKISSIAAINFGDINVIFSKDFFDFLINLFKENDFIKIEWEVVVGNPAEEMYDKIIRKYGGKTIGTWTRSTKLSDGKYYDVKAYEILKENFMASLVS